MKRPKGDIFDFPLKDGLSVKLKVVYMEYCYDTNHKCYFHSSTDCEFNNINTELTFADNALVGSCKNNKNQNNSCIFELVEEQTTTAVEPEP